VLSAVNVKLLDIFNQMLASINKEHEIKGR
jgi:hypothetical protein